MERKPSPEIDDELFNEVYGKEYTGPPRLTANNAELKGKSNMSSIADQSDEEDETRDPNAVPTDFTSREAKVWEAKAKAIERNWKKRKEEELICKICGESGHFTQGCPSTLGANSKTADVFERVPARDKHVRALFSDKVIRQIEKDVGCKIKMDEKFLIVSGKDRLILSKGVDAVHKVIQEDKEDKGNRKSPNLKRMRSKSPGRSPMGSHLRHSESQRYISSPRDSSRFKTKSFNQERVIENDVREDLKKLSRGPPQAYANEGAKDCSARSRSPLRPTFGGDSFSSYVGHNQISEMHKTNNWDIKRHGTDFRADRKFDFSSYPQTFGEMDIEFKGEAMELRRIRDEEEDEENYKHRELNCSGRKPRSEKKTQGSTSSFPQIASSLEVCIRELRENYMRNLAITRGMHTKLWEEFLPLDVQRRQRARHNAYNQLSHPDYDGASRKAQYIGSGLLVDSRGRNPNPSENYSASRSHDAYGEFLHQGHDDFRKAYGRY